MDIILASKSQARQNMLKQCGLDFRSISADIDESSIIDELRSHKKTSEEIAASLAHEKARAIAEKESDSIVIGSDQILILDNQIFQKSNTVEEAKKKLKSLRGKTHYLYSAFCVMKGDDIIDQYCDVVVLTMRNFDNDFLNHYIDNAGDALTQCVGGYAIEEVGSTLFSKIEGDYFTILGMPFLPLLSVLRNQGIRI